MKATPQQTNYLNLLQERALRQFNALGETAGFTPIDWTKEPGKGMTTIDASIKIDAFKQLIRAQNIKLHMMNRRQY